VMRAQGTLRLEGAGDAPRSDEVSHCAPPARGRRVPHTQARASD
jgi:hypothetical protein